jgi:Mg-chelatase subunit ChlD
MPMSVTKPLHRTRAGREAAARGRGRRAARTWPTTLREHRTLVPERLVGCGRQQVVARDVVLAIDQSGSMALSVVYAAVFGAVLAPIRALKTSLVVSTPRLST